MGGSRRNLSDTPTVILTSMIYDISTDSALFAPPKKNIKRNRRVGAFFILLGGAIAGGSIAEGKKTMQIPLWVAGSIKMTVIIAWLFLPERKEEDI